MNFLGFFDQKWIKRSLLHRGHRRAHLKHFEREVGMDKKSGPGKAPCSFLGEFQGAGKGNEVQQLKASDATFIRSLRSLISEPQLSRSTYRHTAHAGAVGLAPSTMSRRRPA